MRLVEKTMRTLLHGSAERIVSPQFGFGKRNNDYGMGFRAYSMLYLTPAKKSLGRMLDFACNELKFEAGDFWDMFLRSGVSVRTIQEFEQRRKDINKAQLDTIVPIAAALYCSVESLIERVP